MPEQTMKGDPALIQASHQFLREWLINRNYVAATAYFSPKSYSCINAVLSADQPRPTTASQYLNSKKEKKKKKKKEKKKKQIKEVIEPAESGTSGAKTGDP